MTKLVERIKILSGKWRVVSPYVGCCDCGLVHRIETRIRRGKLEQRVWREDELTKDVRRRFRYPL